MVGVSEEDKFRREHANMDEDMGEEEEEDPAAAGEPPTISLKRSDLPKVAALENLLREAAEAGMKAAADRAEHDMLTKCLPQAIGKDCEDWVSLGLLGATGAAGRDDNITMVEAYRIKSVEDATKMLQNGPNSMDAVAKSVAQLLQESEASCLSRGGRGSAASTDPASSLGRSGGMLPGGCINHLHK